MSESERSHDVGAATFERQRGMLWGLAYRMTGSAADADDVVQETYLRLASAKPDTGSSLAPWLTRVAMNLARDRLRRRRETPYPGPWLPEPIGDADVGIAQDDPERRESAGYAFLVALEVLTPIQRGVLLLRDVFELSTREAADALAISEANARTTLHRARAALGPERVGERVAGFAPEALVERHREAMGRLFGAVIGGDLDAAIAALSADVQSWQDAGGRYSAATRVVRGAVSVARLLIGIQRHRGDMPTIREVAVNGGVGWWGTYPPSENPRMAPELFLALQVDAAGLVSGLYTLTEPDKLRALRTALGDAQQSSDESEAERS